MDPILIHVMSNFSDNNGDTTGKTNSRRHRSATRGYHQVRDIYSRVARYVHGHGNARREPGQIFFFNFPFIFKLNAETISRILSYHQEKN